MPPPLVSELVRSHEISEIHIRGLEHPSDEADTFREWHGIGEGLRKAAIPRKLHDAVLGELIGTEMSLKVVESGPRCLDHLLHIESMRGIVVNLEVHGTARTRVGLPQHRIAGGQVRIEVQDMRRSHAVFVVVTPALLPGTHGVARRNADLITGRADN